MSTPICCERNSCYRVFPTAIVFSDCVDYSDLKDQDSCFVENFGDFVSCTFVQILKVRINSPPSDSSRFSLLSIFFSTSEKSFRSFFEKRDFRRRRRLPSSCTFAQIQKARINSSPSDHLRFSLLSIFFSASENFVAVAGCLPLPLRTFSGVSFGAAGGGLVLQGQITHSSRSWAVLFLRARISVRVRTKYFGSWCIPAKYFPGLSQSIFLFSTLSLLSLSATFLLLVRSETFHFFGVQIPSVSFRPGVSPAAVFSHQRRRAGSPDS